MAGRIASRRELGSFSSQQAQLQGQEAARGVNDAKKRLDDQILLCLAQNFTTNSQALKATPLSFPVQKGDLWFIEYWSLSHSAGAGGINLSVFGPPNSLVTGVLESSSANTAVANWFSTTFLVLNGVIAACHAGATDAGRPDRIQARIECGDAGRIAIAASTVTAGSISTIDRRALLRATRFSKVFT